MNSISVDIYGNSLIIDIDNRQQKQYMGAKQDVHKKSETERNQQETLRMINDRLTV